MLQWDTWNVNEGVVYKQHKGTGRNGTAEVQGVMRVQQAKRL